MSLDKAIKSGKEWRNPKRPASSQCVNHGSCDYCERNRMYRTNKAIQRAKYDKEELLQEKA